MGYTIGPFAAASPSPIRAAFLRKRKAQSSRLMGRPARSSRGKSGRSGRAAAGQERVNGAPPPETGGRCVAQRARQVCGQAMKMTEHATVRKTRVQGDLRLALLPMIAPMLLRENIRLPSSISCDAVHTHLRTFVICCPVGGLNSSQHVWMWPIATKRTCQIGCPLRGAMRRELNAQPLLERARMTHLRLSAAKFGVMYKQQPPPQCDSLSLPTVPGRRGSR